MPDIPAYGKRDHTGERCLVHDGDGWQQAIVIEPDHYHWAPFFNTLGKVEITHHTCRLLTGEHIGEIVESCLNFRWQ